MIQMSHGTGAKGMTGVDVPSKPPATGAPGGKVKAKAAKVRARKRRKKAAKRVKRG